MKTITQMRINENQRFSKFSLSRQGQMKMMENVGIMFVFFILLVLGFIFYARLGGHAQVQAQDKIFQQRAVKLAQLVAALPEVRCSEDNVQVADCFDILRVQAARDILTDPDNRRYYLDLLSFSTVKVSEIYPDSGEIVLYDREPVLADFDLRRCAKYTSELACIDGDYNCKWKMDGGCVEPIWNSFTPIQIPISIFNGSSSKYKFGILEVGIYEK